MRRLATLVVVAVAAVGCTKGGEAGPAGAQGTAAFLTWFDVPSSMTTSATASLTTYGCETAPYTATGGEVAFITTRVGCSVPAGGSVSVRSAYNDGTSDGTVGFWMPSSNGAATSQNLFNGGTGALQLTAGTTYTFKTAVIDSGASQFCWCQTTVQVAKQP